MLSIRNFSGQLSVIKTTDEDLNVSYTFTDEMGHVVLTRQMKGSETHDTYYVYDDKSNLCFVLQPMYQSSANLDLYAFQYKYDGRNRCIWKKLPGAGYMEMVYDNADRLVFSQDGNQRALTSGNWTYYKYDGLNR
ncbi:RHS repeat-associated core domain-containing protein, partial [Bacteroides sp. AF04-22]